MKKKNEKFEGRLLNSSVSYGTEVNNALRHGTKNNKPLVICITGGVGSGKSYICDLIAEQMSFPVIDSDMTTRVKVMSRGCTGYDKIVETFGKEILDADFDIDRKKLASIVFADPEKLAQLNRITHPATVLGGLPPLKKL